MARYYRIQPRGRGVREHRSWSSAGKTEGVFVFDEPWQTLVLDVPVENYGNEVVEIEAPDSFPSGDVEGVLVAPGSSVITRRWSVNEWGRALARASGVKARGYKDLASKYEDDPEVERAVQSISPRQIPGRRVSSHVRRLRNRLMNG